MTAILYMLYDMYYMYSLVQTLKEEKVPDRREMLTVSAGPQGGDGEALPPRDALSPNAAASHTRSWGAPKGCLTFIFI